MQTKQRNAPGAVRTGRGSQARLLSPMRLTVKFCHLSSSRHSAEPAALVSEGTPPRPRAKALDERAARAVSGASGAPAASQLAKAGQWERESASGRLENPAQHCRFPAPTCRDLDKQIPVCKSRHWLNRLDGETATILDRCKATHLHACTPSHPGWLANWH